MLNFPKDKTIITKIHTNDGMTVQAKLIDINDGDFWGYFLASTEGSATELLRKEVSKINSRVGKWVYQIPAHKYRYMSRKHSDVLKNPDKKKKK